MRRLAVLPLLLAGCLAPGGGDRCGTMVCTDLFAMITVTIVDADDQPVTGLTTTTTYLPTGALVPVSPSFADGVYVVVDDNLTSNTQLAATDAHALRFEATGSAGTVTADYVVRAGPCYCHVEKVSGPERLVLQ